MLQKNILLIAAHLRQQLLGTKLYIQNILPVSDACNMFAGDTSKEKEIEQVNTHLKSNKRLKQFNKAGGTNISNFPSSIVWKQ